MTTVEIIIVGGGPAGSSCARELTAAGSEVLILDRQTFPRPKLCAGWITPRIWRLLKMKPHEYPGQLTTFHRLIFHFYGKRITVPTKQYAIRRLEFDHWLLQISGARLIHHEVKTIEQKNGWFIIDGQFRSKVLVGAAGTHCPIYRHFFATRFPRNEMNRITTLEIEFSHPYRDSNCYLWFFDNDFPGYAWYVPKEKGILNLGIGGKQRVLTERKQHIQQHWQLFAEKLQHLGLMDAPPESVRGYTYFLRNRRLPVQNGPVYLIGDAMGLATLDMGEGIAPAVQSGILAARAILSGKLLSFSSIPRYSFPDILFWWRFSRR